MLDRNKKDLMIILKLISSFLIGVLTLFIMTLFGVSNDTNLTIVGFMILSIGTVVAVYIFVKTILSTIHSKKGFDSHLITIVLSSVLLIGALLFYRPLAISSSKLFYAKHIFIYIILAFLIIYIAIKLSNKTIHKYTISQMKIKLIHLFTVVVVIVSLTILGKLQMFYLNNYAIPPLLSCSYYDRYNNLIYNAQYAGVCPTLDQLEFSDQQLSFVVHEEKYRYDDDRDYGLNPLQEKYTIDTTISYTYDEENRVTDYTIERISKLYVIFSGQSEYQLFLTETYKKQINNLYEENKVTSTHTVYNHKIESRPNEEPYERLMADYTLELVSQITDATDKKLYYDKMIDIKYRNISAGETEYTDLYNVSVELNNESHIYAIQKPSEDDTVTIEKTNHLYSDYDSISRTYSTIAFGRGQTIRSESYSTNNFKPYDVPIPFANTTQTHVNYRTEQNFSDERIFISEIDDSDWLTSEIEKTNFGYVIKHYSNKRDSSGQYQKYPLTTKYNPGFKEYNSLMDNEQINNYHLALYYPGFKEVEFIYQKNPLLFEQDFETNN